VCRHLLLAAVLLAPATAAAHNQSQGHSTFTLRGNILDATVFLTAADYQQLVGLDPNEDGLISDEEARNSESVLGVFVGQTLRALMVEEDGHEEICVPSFGGLDLLAAEGLPRLYPFHLRLECPSAPSKLKLRMGLFVGTGIRHINLGRITLPDGRVEELLFTPDAREVLVTASPKGVASVAWEFWLLGVEHILTGYDHLLFLLSLLLMALRFRDVVVLVTSFTVAHSVTLGLAALGVATLPARLVEPAIAASIVYVSLEDLWLLRRHVQPRLPRAGLAFAFGLIHGFGFASALESAHLPRGSLVLALGTFNVGVETGQLLFCALMFAVLTQVRKTRAAPAILMGTAVCSALMGAVWLVARLRG
jgi:hydrogenase/urease accessory protein HupE